MPRLQALSISVFAIEALVKGAQLTHLLGALALGLLFTALVLTERGAS